MSEFVCAISAMSVALLYCTWRTHFQQAVQRQTLLRERVTYMLWVMANSVPEGQ
jgi:formate-dependent nitrite reductase membrane component NrfD